MKVLLVVVLSLFLTACANPGIVRLSPDTYMLFREDHAGIFGNLAKMKIDVIRQANEFAESQGKVAIPISMKEKPVGILGDWASFEYQFRIVDDPEARRMSLVPRPDSIIEKKEEQIQPIKKLSRGINIAISEFIAKNTSAADASIVTDFIRTELVSCGEFNILERANMETILAEQKFQVSGCTSQECAVKMGKILNVKVVLIGSLSKLMDTYYITVSLVDVETGKILQSIDQDAKTATELKQSCKQIVEKIK